MKVYLSAMLVICILIMNVGCNKKMTDGADQVEKTPAPVQTAEVRNDSAETVASPDLMPLYFGSEAQLIETVRTVKKGADTVSIEAINKEWQSCDYDAKGDVFKLALLDTIYAPERLPDGAQLVQIKVKNEYLSYKYVDKEGRNLGFTWYREMTPEVAMNDLDNRGAAMREIEKDGVTYVILEWLVPGTGITDGYTIQWVSEGRPYSAGMDAGYTDEQMLDFCKYKKIPVR